MAVKGKKKTKAEPVLQSYGGYQLIQPWMTKGAGTSKWSFAEKNGRTFFIKEFIKPVLPEASSGISPEKIARKKRICESFYAKKCRVYEAVNRSANGNIIRIEDFFFDRTKFYLVTERVDGPESDPSAISNLPHEKKMLFLKVLAHSLRSLYNNHVVHADLKPGNVLIKQVEGNTNLVPKLIDFGESFLVEEPSDELVGDRYLAPETCKAMFGGAVALTQKLDVFALGLMFHEYYTGVLPSFDSGYLYPFEAVLDGKPLTVLAESFERAPMLPGLIERMLAADPEARPDMETVLAVLNQRDAADQPVLPPPPPPLPKWTCSSCGAENTGDACAYCGGRRSMLKKRIRNIESQPVPTPAPEPGAAAPEKAEPDPMGIAAARARVEWDELPARRPERRKT